MYSALDHDCHQSNIKKEFIKDTRNQKIEKLGVTQFNRKEKTHSFSPDYTSGNENHNQRQQTQ